MKFEDKYAPQSLADVVFPSATTQKQIMAIGAMVSRDDLLLHGPHGTGKSTIAALIYKEWYGDLPCCRVSYTGPKLSTDSSAAGPLHAIRNLGNFNRNFRGHGLVIIDELDVVAKNSQYLLREIMQANFTRPQFVFTTNHPTKVYSGIRDACRVIEFPYPTPQQWLPRAQHILRSEGVSLPDANVINILSGITGGVRSICRLLQDTVLQVQQNTTAAESEADTAQPSITSAMAAVSLLPQNAPVSAATQPTP